MTHEDILLHLSQAEPSLLAAALGWLLRQQGHRSAGTAVYLVADLVIQFQIVSGPHQYLGVHLFAGDAVVHRFLAVSLEAKVFELVSESIHILAVEGSSVHCLTSEGADLAADDLHYL